MEAVLFIIGAVWTLIGSFVVLYTEWSQRIFGKTMGTISLRILAVLPLVMGVLLILAGPWSRSLWVTEVLGALAVVKGLLLLLLPREKINPLITWWQEKASPVSWRLYGLILVILGVFLVLRS